jgi:uncharacterized protein YbjT (DUF2867 family)/uncharacterized protein YndB with AHSA1/START domain
MAGMTADLPSESPTVLVTGATGYIGSRLVPELLAAGRSVRVLTRTASRLEGRSWRGSVEVVEGDADVAADMVKAMDGVAVAYYLLHSMGSGADDFAGRERAMATTFADAAAAAGVRRVVYLGGLHPPDEQLSEHLASRTEVGSIMLDGAAPAAVLQAAVIVGSGSASFEMLRHLAQRLPAMVAPKWLMNRIQPIAVRDVLYYLVRAADLPPEVNRTFDIGGPDVLTYRQMIDRFCEVAGLPRRLIVTIPVLTPRLAGHWVGLVTPVPGGLAKPLVESLIHEVVCQERDLVELVGTPPGGLLGFTDAVRTALEGTQEYPVVKATDVPSHSMTGDPRWTGETVYRDETSSVVAASPQEVWAVVEAVGGENGWHVPDVVWQVRGLADRAIGGPGLRRGRPDRPLRVGDRVDLWVVEDVVDGRRLLLRAESRLPGEAWLELTVAPDAGGGTRLSQLALFHPRGLAGHLYWGAMLVAHIAAFRAMHRGMAAAASGERVRSRRSAPPPG